MSVQSSASAVQYFAQACSENGSAIYHITGATFKKASCALLLSKTRIDSRLPSPGLSSFRELAAELRCNIMGYDYSGYGTSTGIPSVAHTL